MRNASNRQTAMQALTVFVVAFVAFIGFATPGGDSRIAFAAPGTDAPPAREHDTGAPYIPRDTPLPRGAADRDCRDFDSHDEAQAFLEATEGDPHRLDGDDDGVACERLR
ncbi:MAG: excalibur calcium-binding domain-containing protein [Micropepsaceae bacterium]